MKAQKIYIIEHLFWGKGKFLRPLILFGVFPKLAADDVPDPQPQVLQHLPQILSVPVGGLNYKIYIHIQQGVPKKQRCSKTKTKFFCMEPSQQGEPLKIIKKNFADFWKFYYATFLVNLHHFSYFDPTKKSTIFKNNFQRHSYISCAPLFSRMHTMQYS